MLLLFLLLLLLSLLLFAFAVAVAVAAAVVGRLRRNSVVAVGAANKKKQNCNTATTPAKFAVCVNSTSDLAIVNDHQSKLAY